MQAGGESAPINRHLSLLHFYIFWTSVLVELLSRKGLREYIMLSHSRMSVIGLKRSWPREIYKAM